MWKTNYEEKWIYFNRVTCGSRIVILTLTFMFIAPKLSSLIKEGENTDKRLIEEQIIDSAKKSMLQVMMNFLKIL